MYQSPTLVEIGNFEELTHGLPWGSWHDSWGNNWYPHI
ncbi:lasso RiPP family leader peptide-containing protein [Gordonia sp. PDNC005]|nr:lasso RiPP family leader peptide-containing protein [Gordonia sp. PDNC005]